MSFFLALFICCVIILTLSSVLRYMVRVGSFGVFIGLCFCICLVICLVRVVQLSVFGFLFVVFCVLFDLGCLCVFLALQGCFLVMFIFSLCLFVRFIFISGVVLRPTLGAIGMSGVWLVEVFT